MTFIQPKLYCICIPGYWL